MKVIIFAFLLLTSLSALAAEPHPFYPSSIHQKIWSMNVKNAGMKKLLKDVLQKVHVERVGKADKLSDYCPKGERCYERRILSYYEARKNLFGRLHLERDEYGYFVKDVYCNKVFDNDTPDIKRIGPMEVPNHKVVNCEHTWPQSRFSKFYDHEEQKSDLHHLFPTENLANSIRGNYRFGEVSYSTEGNLCGTSHFGIYLNHPDTKSFHDFFFEPPMEHRGNVARALFYFSIKYDLSISLDEEYYLRKWNYEDPIDQEERDRNNAIYEIQYNRNPFIDYPFIIELISDF